jgi:hypothetical protein
MAEMHPSNASMSGSETPLMWFNKKLNQMAENGMFMLKGKELQFLTWT